MRPSNEKIWLNSRDEFTTNSEFKTVIHNNDVQDVHHSNDLFDRPKQSKGKLNSNAYNGIGSRKSSYEKPRKRDKWNFNPDDDEDYIYWDSINNHAEISKGKQKSAKEVGLLLNLSLC